MKIYNYLFYKTYLLMSRSKNWNDTPALGGSLFVIACIMFNMFTILLFLEGLKIVNHWDFIHEYKYFFSLLLVSIIWFYYSYKKRYKLIINNYEQKFSGKNQLHPIFVILIYYSSSFGLLILAGLYKNHHWIFK